MKKIRVILICTACLLAVACSIYVIMGVRHQESESGEGSMVQAAPAAFPQRLTFGFDDSFRDHFGAHRVAIIEAALEVAALSGMTDPDEMLRYATREYRVSYEVR